MRCTRSERRRPADASPADTSAADASVADASPADDGMVTAELAACLPVLVLLVGVVLGAVAVVSAHVRAQDAAREAARAVARGDPAAARRLAREALPGARLSTGTSGADVTAVVSTSVHPLGGWLPAFPVTERAVAAREPDGDDGG